MRRIGMPGGLNFPYEIKWDGGEAIVYAEGEAQAIRIFKTSTLFSNQATFSIRLMSDNE